MQEQNESRRDCIPPLPTSHPVTSPASTVYLRSCVLPSSSRWPRHPCRGIQSMLPLHPVARASMPAPLHVVSMLSAHPEHPPTCINVPKHLVAGASVTPPSPTCVPRLLRVPRAHDGLPFSSPVSPRIPSVNLIPWRHSACPTYPQCLSRPSRVPRATPQVPCVRAVPHASHPTFLRASLHPSRPLHLRVVRLLVAAARAAREARISTFFLRFKLPLWLTGFVPKHF